MDAGASEAAARVGAGLEDGVVVLRVGRGTESGAEGLLEGWGFGRSLSKEETPVAMGATAREAEMVRLDETTAACGVLVYKEGILSAMAHDLRLTAARFSLEVGVDQVVGRWEAAALKVETVMREGVPAPGVLSARDFAKIERTIAEDVLSVKRFPEIRFESTELQQEGANAVRIAGKLSLAGQTRTIATRATRMGGEWKAEVRLNQVDFGIRPYSAMLGALKIQAEVVVVVTVPTGALGGLFSGE